MRGFFISKMKARSLLPVTINMLLQGRLLNAWALKIFRVNSPFVLFANPYDHMVSLYHYIKQSRGHYLHFEANSMSFNAFIRHYLTTSPRRQTDFVYLGNKQIVSFVGKFERLEDDLKKSVKILVCAIPM